MPSNHINVEDNLLDSDNGVIYCSMLENNIVCRSHKQIINTNQIFEPRRCLINVQTLYPVVHIQTCDFFTLRIYLTIISVLATNVFEKHYTGRSVFLFIHCLNVELLYHHVRR